MSLRSLSLFVLGTFLVCQISLAQQISPAEKYALALQKTFQDNGYDVEVLPLEDERILELKSDIFRDPELRESAASQLYKDRKTLCGFGIWYVQVGYSKGMLSSDVMKHISLGCPAAKTAHLKEAEADRQKFAASLVSDMSTQGVRPSVGGLAHTTMILEADDWNLKGASRFARMLMGSPVEQDLCRLGFRQLQLRNKSQPLKTLPLACK